MLKKGKKRATAVVAAIASRPRPEVTAVVTLLGAVVLGLSLASYDGLGPDGLPFGSNIMGAVGRYLAFVVLQLFGFASGYYLALLVVLGVIWFSEARHDVTLGTLMAYLGVGFLLSAQLHLGAGGRTVLGGHELGGSVGELVGGATASLFSVWGGAVVCVALIAVLVVVTTPKPLLAVLRRAWSGVRFVARGFLWAARGTARLWRSSRSRSGTTESTIEVVEAEPRKAVGRATKPAPAPVMEPVAAEAIGEKAAEPPATAPVPVPTIHARSSMPGRSSKAAAAEEKPEERYKSISLTPARPSAAAAELGATMHRAGDDEIERVIEAARRAGFFDPVREQTSADSPPAASPVVPTAAAQAPAAEATATQTATASTAALAPAAAAEGLVIHEAPKRKRAPRKAGALEHEAAKGPVDYRLPVLELLSDPPERTEAIGKEVLIDYAAKLTQTLKNYGIEGTVNDIHPGPVVTTYEFCPAAGTRLSKISSLENDVAMAMAVTKVRIVAPIPGKNAVGFEIPNPTRETVFLKELMADQAFERRGGLLPIAIGKDLTGKPYYSDLAKMPHLLVAGATGTGKSVFINSTLVSLLFRQSPEQMRLLLIDPKHVELIGYDRIPHLLLPVVSDMRKAALALRWAVGEMERRYHIFAGIGARQLSHYNQKVAARKEGKTDEAAAGATAKVKIVVKGPDGVARELAPPPAAPVVTMAEEPLEKMPAIVIVIDELAELMSVAAKDVESAIQRLAQKGRAAGIHLIVATQRPSVDVITGTIKANFPTRLSFKVSSKTDSRTVLDQNGADQLLGMGDMLLLPPGTSDLLRIQACYVSEDEIERVVNHIRTQGEPTYDESIVAEQDEDGEGEDAEAEDYDEHWEDALELVLRLKQASISKIQRHLRLGYNRAARIVERMEHEGLVGPGDNPREKEIYPERIIERLGAERERPEGNANDEPRAADPQP
jgi:S-DNA-T family DNA segregation ATPase FtsK/SpoIIIE